jgi:hypothetical protein
MRADPFGVRNVAIAGAQVDFVLLECLLDRQRPVAFAFIAASETPSAVDGLPVIQDRVAVGRFDIVRIREAVCPIATLAERGLHDPRSDLPVATVEQMNSRTDLN